MLDNRSQLGQEMGPFWESRQQEPSDTFYWTMLSGESSSNAVPSLSRFWSPGNGEVGWAGGSHVHLSIWERNLVSPKAARSGACREICSYQNVS